MPEIGSVQNSGFNGANINAEIQLNRQGQAGRQADYDNVNNIDYFRKKYGQSFLNAGLYDRVKQEAAQKQVDDVRNQQVGQYKDFQNNLDFNKGQSYGLLAGQERGRLNNEIKQNDNSMNQRGLLYSGIRQGADAASQVRSNTNLARERTSVNQQMDDQAEAMRSGAMKTGFDIQQNQQMVADMAYQTALQNMAASKTMMGNVFGVVGGVVGGAYGGPMGAAGGAVVGQGVGQAVG